MGSKDSPVCMYFIKYYIGQIPEQFFPLFMVCHYTKMKHVRVCEEDIRGIVSDLFPFHGYSLTVM